MHKTRNGAYCIVLGPRRTPKGERVAHDHKGHAIYYLQCQMLPIDPQRIEWIREDNLTPVEG